MIKGSHCVAPAAGTLPRAVPIAGDVELVSAADDDAIEARDRRLADVAQPVVRLDERAHPLPIIARVLQKMLALLPQIRPGAEGALPRPGQHDNRDAVIERGILKGAAQFRERLEIERVEHIRAVNRHRRAPIPLLIDDALESE